MSKVIAFMNHSRLLDLDDFFSAKLMRLSFPILPEKAVAISSCSVPSSQSCPRHVFHSKVTELFVVFFTNISLIPVFTIYENKNNYWSSVGSKKKL